MKKKQITYWALFDEKGALINDPHNIGEVLFYTKKEAVYWIGDGETVRKVKIVETK